MNNHPYKVIGYVMLAASACAAQSTRAEQQDVSEDVFYNGGYVAPMATVGMTVGAGELGTRLGGTLVPGYRADYYAIEARGFFTQSMSSGSDAEVSGGLVDGLLFPFRLSESKPSENSFIGRMISNSYVLLGAGGISIKNYPDVDASLSAKIVQAGIGDIIPFKVSRYKFGLRIEALYQYGERTRDPDELTNSRPDVDAPLHFGDVIFNLGLHLPFGLEPIPEAPPEPAQIVAPIVPSDSDGDGVADALDMCPGTPAGTSVDSRGCPLPLPPPPCKTPEPGAKVDLRGCTVGDVIVLRGVNFEFDKARLTVNAETILEGVASELIARPDIKVEVSGHTDSKGSDSYNQELSERRAQSVVDYLTAHGIDAARLTSKGLGETQPLADNDTDEGRELNRRVELRITESADPATLVTPATGPAAEATPTEAPLDAAAPEPAELPATP
ncbi:MAG: hypothetical protein JWQ90_2497 [Hydrocarboniphaga sp.]|uniref:OmpA family protein n=1 Tax=Hydrocarboniphaga sp. TaxID=2033016 RepID=UPI0026213CF6|nr:OmpA family protein [Hydrocarboniphaga sp.]MDB5970047.1 hypothetical protein [Hydrocarboniphaga sp.]